MKQLEFNFERKNKYFDSDIERRLFKDFCKYMYSENTRERLREKEKPYKRIGLYVRKNWDFLYREWQKQLNCQFSKGEIS
jgi:hypothetical protein